MFDNKFKKTKKFVKDHKIEIGMSVTFVAVTVFTGVVLKKLIDMDVYVTEDEWPDNCIEIDGKWVPIQSEDGSYYADAFANDDVRREFQDLGYRIIERD